MVAAARADGESTHVVFVQPANRVYVDVDFFGLLGRQLVVCVGESDI